MCYKENIKVLFILLLSICCHPVAAKVTTNFSGYDFPVKGIITDASTGKPIAEASVVIAGTQKGTITNADGEFNISADNADAQLEISAINYVTQKVKAKGSSTLIIKLELKANSLGEVVVVGYGTQTKATLTGSVSQIKGSEILKSPAPNVANNIAGRIPGVITTNNQGEPGNDDPRIIIRGINTFSGSTEPLYVIDGVANRPGGFSRLNPNDIESISVLKDASAAIYGAQAANGVVLITTKRGKVGAPQISFSYNQAFNSWVKIPERVNAFEFATLLNEDNRYNGGAPVFTDDELQKYRDGSDPLNYPNTDWVKQVVRNVTLQNNLNLSVSGGTDKAKYYGSFGRVHQGGQFKNSDAYKYEQYNLSLNVDVQPVDFLKISFETQLRYTDRKPPAGGAGNSPNNDVYGSQGSYNLFGGLLFSLPNQLARFPDGRLATTNPISWLNPLATSTDIAGNSRFNSIYALNTFRYRVDVPAVEGLFVDGFVSADFETSDSKDFGKSWDTYYYNKLTNEYTLIKQTTASEGLASLNQSSYNRLVFTVNGKLNFKKVINNVHSINSFLLFEQQQYNDRYFFASRRNFVTDNIEELAYGSPINALNGGGSSNTARRSYSGRINYAYDNKYLLDVQARYDGSDRFSKNRRWGLFPSISAGWVISGESWAKGFVKDNNLKLTASYGILGNDRIDPYQFLQFYNLNTTGYIFNGQLASTISPGVLPNPDFTWETAKTFNIGLTGTFLAKSFNYTVEFFRQTRSDILTTRDQTTPSYTGLIVPVQNFGKMQNQGIEVQIGYNKKIGNVLFNTSANLTVSQNKVLLIDEAPPVSYQKQIGFALNSLTLYESDGLFQSQADIDGYLSKYDYQAGIQGSTLRPGDVKFKDVNGDGIINNLDQVRKNGNEQPNIIFGLSTSVNWKSFDLSFLLQGQAGSKVFFYPQGSSNLNYYKFLYNGRSTPEQVTDKPTTAGSSFNRPGFLPNDFSFFYRNTSFVRLKSFEIGYSLKSLLSRIKVTNARIYVNGSNLLTFAKFNDFDPESLNKGDARGYPMLRTINAGIQITF